MKKKLKQGPVKFAEKEQINGHITLIVGLYNILVWGSMDSFQHYFQWRLVAEENNKEKLENKI